MVRFRLPLAAALALTAGAAWADLGREELQVLEGAKLTIADAVSRIETAAGGKAVDVEFEANDGRGQYEVKVVSSDDVHTHKIDATTGEVLDTDKALFSEMFNRLKPEAVSGARTSLTQAIAMAERQAGGRVIDAEVDDEDGRIQYEMTVVGPDGNTQELTLDDGTGQLAADD